MVEKILNWISNEQNRIIFYMILIAFIALCAGIWVYTVIYLILATLLICFKKGVFDKWI